MIENQSLKHTTNKKPDKRPDQLKFAFDHLESYSLKVAFYDQHFGIIPFNFPSFDPDLTWYHSESSFLYLASVVNRERNRSCELYEQRINHAGETYSFSIKPVTEQQKWFLNQYIFQKFLQERIDIAIELKMHHSESTDHAEYLRSRLIKIEHLISRIRQMLMEPNESMMRVRFMSIFLKGFDDYGGGTEKMFKVKRKFIELFLISQGFLLAEYVHSLKEALAGYTNNAAEEVHELLKQKIGILKDLGVISFLENKLKKSRQKNNLEKLAEWVCMITATDPGFRHIVQQQLKFYK